MRAYVFWHQPRPGSDLRNYELAVRDFHEALRRASDSVEGFMESHAHRLDGAPWLPAGVAYEDWYLIASSAALDPLDRAAISVRARAAHDRVAAMAGGCAGGLYRSSVRQREATRSPARRPPTTANHPDPMPTPRLRRHATSPRARRRPASGSGSRTGGRTTRSTPTWTGCAPPCRRCGSGRWCSAPRPSTRSSCPATSLRPPSPRTGIPS